MLDITPAGGGPQLLDHVRTQLRAKRYSARTEESYLDWVRRYLQFHGHRNPCDMGAPEIEAFLTHLVVDRSAAQTTRNQALSALVFLYRHVYARELPTLRQPARAKKTRYVTVTLTREQVRALLDKAGVEGDGLVLHLLYGAGLRLAEALRLRVGDLQLPSHEIVVRDGRGQRERVTVLPRSLVPALQAHLERRRVQYEADLATGVADVWMPDVSADPGAATQWNWQYLFVADTYSLEPSPDAIRRHHLSEKCVERSLARALAAAHIAKSASSLTLRQCFASHLLESGCDMASVQRLLGQDGGAVAAPSDLRSPLDA